MKPFEIGIDLGGTKVEAILFDPRGRELFRRRVATPREEDDTYRAIVETVGSLIKTTARQIPQGADYTVGVGIPGIQDPASRRITGANTTSLIGRPFQDDLQARLGHAVAIENDANCFTLAEALKGAARDFGMVFGVILGTGCGGGLCINGRIHHGRHGIAGEWGHYAMDPSGGACFCGNMGCVETKISGTWVAKDHQQRTGRQLTMQQIVAGAHQGEAECRETIERFLEAFGRALGGLISILDPDAVVIGGGLSNIDELYSEGRERVAKYAFHPHITTPILKNRLGDSAGVYGAAWIGRSTAS
jgi:fructokinase